MSAIESVSLTEVHVSRILYSVVDVDGLFYCVAYNVLCVSGGP